MLFDKQFNVNNMSLFEKKKKTLTDLNNRKINTITNSSTYDQL